MATPRKIGTRQDPPARVHVLLARERPLGVIIRRGPSRCTQLLLWRTDSDEIIPGQWVKAKVFENRCDLSPKGDKLLYCASNWDRREVPVWNAISTPPYFTAIVFQPKFDAWGGGGLFQDDKTVVLNSIGLAGELEAAPPFLKITHGNLGHFDMAVMHARMVRDGWKALLAEKEVPRVYKKRRPGGLEELFYFVEGYVPNRPDGNFITKCSLFGLYDETLWSDYCSFADWDHQGRLVFVKRGVLYAVSKSSRGVYAPRMIHDFSPYRFKQVVAPPEAKDWRAP